MALTLSIQFGGLCMLWQSRSRKNMYVLMPTVRHGGTEDEDDQNHCQMMICNGQYVGLTPDVPYIDNIRGKHIDLSKIARPGSVKSMRGFATPAKYANAGGSQIPVAKALLDETALPFYLSARVVLPLPSQNFELLGSKAYFKVPNAGSAVELYGRAEIEYPNAVLSELQKFSRPFTPVADGSGGEVIEIGLLNVRVKDLNNPTHYRHYKGEPWKHQQAYYHLLEAYGDDEREGPPAIFDRTSGTGREKPTGKDNDCSKAKPAEWPPSPPFVDPYTCTLGGGCEPEGAC